MGCYPIGFIRAVTEEEPTVTSARAGLYGRLIDRWMRATMKLPSGGDVNLFVGMRCRNLLSVSMKIRGSAGSIGILNFIKPEVYHRLKVRSASGVRRERVPGSSTYRTQLAAFADAVRTGEPPVTTIADSVKNARVIDAVYLAAGLPVRGDSSVLERLRDQGGNP
jgi:predicted dehydrogenase